MKKWFKTLLIISLLFNIVIIVGLIIPKYRYLWWSTYIDSSSFNIWWFVQPINFEWPKKTYEWYLIYWTEDRNTNKMDYFYINALWNRWWLVFSNPQTLNIKSDDKETLVLYDEIYEFTINKNDWKISWKDKDWKLFELWLKKYRWF